MTKRIKNKYFGIVMICASVIAIIIMGISIYKYVEKSTFRRPDFDANAIVGVPIVEESLGYKPIAIENVYTISLCGSVEQDKKSLKVYFTSSEENEAYVKIRIYDEKEELLGESGLLKPGEYVENVSINREVKSGSKILLKVMGYDPKNYYSVGAIELNTSIK